MINSLITITSLILICYVFACLPEGNFRLEYITPQFSSPDVPIDAVIRVTFLTKNRIEEDSLSTDAFTLSKVVKKEPAKDEKKTETAAQPQDTNAKKESTEELVQVGGILKTKEPKPVIVDGESWYRTNIYFVPIPEQKKKGVAPNPPLLPNQKYKFVIGELKAGSDKFTGYTLDFTTKDSGGSFFATTESPAHVVSPRSLSHAMTNTPLVIEFDKAVSPLRIKKHSYTQSTAICEDMTLDDSEVESLKMWDILYDLTRSGGQFDPSNTADGTGFTKAQQEAIDKTVRDNGIDSDLKDELEGKLLDYLAEDEEGRKSERVIYRNTRDELKKKENGSNNPCKPLAKSDRDKSTDLAISYLEDFSQAKDQKYVTAKYKTIMILPPFDAAYKYDLALCLATAKCFQTYKDIMIDEGPDNPDMASFIGNRTEIDFFTTESEDEE